jgi:hypothetical protein
VGGKEVKRVGEKGISWGFVRGKTKERVEIERKRVGRRRGGKKNVDGMEGVGVFCILSI